MGTSVQIKLRLLGNSKHFYSDPSTNKQTNKQRKLTAQPKVQLISKFLLVSSNLPKKQ